MSPGLSTMLAELFSGGSVLDLGAGLAQYETDWEQKGLIGRDDGIVSVTPNFFLCLTKMLRK